MKDEKRYEALYLRVYSYVMTLARDRSRAEEITQTAFFKAVTAEKNATFRSDAEEATWLCAIAKNVFFDEERKRKHVAELTEDLPAEEDFTSAVADEDLSYRIHVVLHSLEEPYKEVFSLRVFGDLSFGKIASIFGKTETWARVTYHRAKLKIQEKMEGSD